MNKLILLTLLSLSISACGQKGPLIVDQAPADKSGPAIEGDTDDRSATDSETRVGRQVEGEPSIIYR